MHSAGQRADWLFAYPRTAGEFGNLAVSSAIQVERKHRVASSAPRRKVLIIEDEPSIRNVLYVLLAAIGCDAETVSSGAQALALVERERFDALLLDLRCSNVQAEEVVGGVQRIRPSLIGRVLLVTGEVEDQKTLDLVERNFLLHVPRNRLEEIRGIVSAMLTIAPSAKISS